MLNREVVKLQINVCGQIWYEALKLIIEKDFERLVYDEKLKALREVISPSEESQQIFRSAIIDLLLEKFDKIPQYLSEERILFELGLYRCNKENEELLLNASVIAGIDKTLIPIRAITTLKKESVIYNIVEGWSAMAIKNINARLTNNELEIFYRSRLKEVHPELLVAEFSTYE